MISDIVGKIQNAEQAAAALVEEAKERARAIAMKANEEAAAHAAEQEAATRAKAVNLLAEADRKAESAAKQVLDKKSGESEALGRGAAKNLGKAVAYIVERVG